MNTKLLSTFVIIAGLFASSAANAQSLKLDSVIKGLGEDVVDVATPRLQWATDSSVWAGNLSVTFNGQSSAVLAYSFDYNVLPSGGNSLFSSTPVVDTRVANLYSNYYANSLTSASNAATFQLALWKIQETNCGLTCAGDVYSTTPAGDIRLGLANTWANALPVGASSWSVTKFYKDDGATFLVAQAVPAVPEPETYAMLLAGLGLMSVVARRRKQK
jgi:hypothetical protein